MRTPVAIVVVALPLAACGDRTALLVPEPAQEQNQDAALSIAPSCAGGGIVTIASRPQFTWLGASMAVDATNVYWLEHGDAETGPGRVMRAPKCGGAAVQVAPTLNFVEQIAIDGTNAYWTNSTTNSAPGGESGQIMSAPLAGGAPTTLATVLPVPWGIAIDATGVYWTEDSSLARVPKVGGPTVTLASGPSPWQNVAVNDTVVVWTNQPSEGWSVAATAKSTQGGGDVTTVASTNTGLIGALAVDDTQAYFAAFAPGYGASGQILTAPLAGGGSATSLATGYPTSLAVDGPNLYWTDYPNMTGAGAVYRVPKSGGVTTTLASELEDAPSAVAVDDTRVYWLGATTVMSALK